MLESFRSFEEIFLKGFTYGPHPLFVSWTGQFALGRIESLETIKVYETG